MGQSESHEEAQVTNPISHGLHFEATNLGTVRRGRFTHRPLTIFCGPNNAGKTWTTYALYHFLSTMATFPRDDEEPLELKEFNRHVTEMLPFLFNSDHIQFRRTTFHIADGPGWREIARSPRMTPDVFLMPAERSGLHLFFRELSQRRTALLHHASRPSIRIHELLRDVMRSRYALPIARYIDWLNELPDLTKDQSEDFHQLAEKVKRDLVKGAYRVSRRTGTVYFRPYQIRGEKTRAIAMGLHLTSGAVKSLFGLWFYLEHQAKAGDVLMLDEPELNIHPENQRKIARLLARLVNAGLNVTISTHSDYIVRELNILMMLANEQVSHLRRRYGYDNLEILNPDDVGAYLFDRQTITPFEINPTSGISATTFDHTITDANEITNEIYYELRSELG